MGSEKIIERIGAKMKILHFDNHGSILEVHRKI
jgi:hypothetical protein